MLLDSLANARVIIGPVIVENFALYAGLVRQSEEWAAAIQAVASIVAQQEDFSGWDRFGAELYQPFPTRVHAVGINAMRVVKGFPVYEDSPFSAFYNFPTHRCDPLHKQRFTSPLNHYNIASLKVVMIVISQLCGDALPGAKSGGHRIRRNSVASNRQMRD